MTVMTALALVAAPAAAHPNSASGKAIGVVDGELKGQGHFKGIDCNAADAGMTPFPALGICDK